MTLVLVVFCFFLVVLTIPMCSHFIPFIMPRERTIYFANNDAYNIDETIHYIYTLQDRIQLFEFDHVIASLMDMKFLSQIFHGDEMLDVFTGQFIRRDTWFLRYGIRDSTLDYFDGANASDVHTFSVGDIEFTNPNEEAITASDEEDLVDGSFLNPIEIDIDDISVFTDSDGESVVVIL